MSSLSLVRHRCGERLVGLTVTNSLLPLSGLPFEAIIAKVEQATSMAELQAALESVLGPYGLKHVVYHALRIPPASIHQQALVHTYPDEWISHYAARRYYLIDPVVLEAQRGILPIDWNQLDKEPKQVRRLFREADDVGVGRHGITIPIRGVFGERALVTVTSDCSDRDWEKLRVLYLRDMQLIATYAHSRVLAIHGLTMPNYAARLSRRERECLQWAAAGKTVDDTADILTLSSSAVRLYLDSARHKLDSLTKTQAVARALSLGIITI